jgi:hypothetical protein
MHGSCLIQLIQDNYNTILPLEAIFTKFYRNCTRMQHSHYAERCNLIIQLQNYGVVLTYLLDVVELPVKKFLSNFTTKTGCSSGIKCPEFGTVTP